MNLASMARYLVTKTIKFRIGVLRVSLSLLDTKSCTSLEKTKQFTVHETAGFTHRSSVRFRPFDPKQND